jgi:Kef-type K+ transport system membrane component KefB
MEDLAHAAVTFALWLGIILVAAKLGAELFERVLHQPAVVGELVAGIIIGPFALGGLALPVFGTLFPVSDGGGVAVPESLWVFGQVAAVLLLFVAGLETDFTAFRRFGVAASLVAIGGVVLPFALGDAAAVVFGLAESPMDPTALFMGVILTATSLGVTARLLSDLGKLDTPEGVTILGAAVIDDVLGVIVLGLVAAVATSGVIEPLEVGLLGVQTVVLWLALTGLLLVAAATLARAIDGLSTAGAVVSLSFALALLSGVAAESIGLAMIIGAYSAGLALSRSSLRGRLLSEMRTVQHVLVPAFFVTMGMLVDLRAIVPVLGLGLVLTLLAMVGKVVGCAVPALVAGFNTLGSIRIGLGMMPRGEVALIVAGVGLGTGVISDAVFGVAVLVAVATTVAAPVLMKPAFQVDRPGVRAIPHVERQREEHVRLTLAAGLAETFERHLAGTLESAGFQSVGTWDDLHGGHGIELQRGDDLVSLESRDEAHELRLVRLDSEAPIDGLDELVSEAATAAAQEVSDAVMTAARPVQA